MSGARQIDVETRFARRATRGRGVGLDDAVAAAEARLDGMRDDARSAIDAMLAGMQAARPAIAAQDSAAYAMLRAQADALTGVAPVFQMEQVGLAAQSLRQLYDATAPGQPSPNAVRVHLDALLVFRSADAETLALSAPALLQGLKQIVAAAHRPG